jgi:hypothetical protein
MNSTLSTFVERRFVSFLKWFSTTIVLYMEPLGARQEIWGRYQDRERENRRDAKEVTCPLNATPRLYLPEIPTTPRLILFLASVARDLAQSAITHCIQVVVECLPSFNPMDPVRAFPPSLSIYIYIYRDKRMGGHLYVSICIFIDIDIVFVEAWVRLYRHTFLYRVSMEAFHTYLLPPIVSPGQRGTRT